MARPDGQEGERSGPLSEDEAAQKITGFFRRAKAHRNISRMAINAVGKAWSEKHSSYYYYSKLSNRTWWHKPHILGNLDVDDDLTLAYRDSLALTPRSKVKEQLKIEQEQTKRNRAIKKKMANRVKPNHELGLPEAPIKVAASASDGTAGVWWTPGPTNGANVVQFHVRRYRLDGEPMVLQSLEEGDQPKVQTSGEPDDMWHFKGSTAVPADTHKVMIKNLTNGKQYRFSVVAECYDKGVKGLGYVSEMSNIVMPDKALPEGWRWIRDGESGRVYYYNFKTKQTTWNRPEEDQFFVRTEDYLCFNPHEIESFKKHFQRLDYDHQGTISSEEFQAFVWSVGESMPFKKLHPLLVDHKIASGINFNQFCSLLATIKDGIVPKIDKFDFLAHLNHASGNLRRIMVKHRIHVNRRLVQRDLRRMGEWSKFIDPVLNMSYYFNEVTQTTTWVMPEEVKYYLPPDLRALMDRTFTKEEIEKFKAEFSCFDLDNSGAIDEDELAIVLKELGENVSKKFLRAMIKEVDSDSSGEVDFDEFCIMLLGILKGKKSEFSAFRERFSKGVGADERKAWFKRVREQYLQNKKLKQEESNRELLAGAAVGARDLKKVKRLRKLEKMHEPTCLCGCRSLADDPEWELDNGIWKNTTPFCAVS